MITEIKTGKQAIEKQRKLLVGLDARSLSRLFTCLPVLISLMLLWNYGDTTNIVFEIWQSTDLVNWNQVDEVTQTQWQIPPGQQQQFFKVRARNTISGLESFWNQ